jgi:hypothetical protein
LERIFEQKLRPWKNSNKPDKKQDEAIWLIRRNQVLTVEADVRIRSVEGTKRD